MEKIIALLSLITLTGCANGTPIDFLVPTPKPSPATAEYLGHLARTNYVNGMYYSLSDTKINLAMVPLRHAELTGLKIVAQGELEYFDKIGSAVSNGLWGLVVVIAGALGYQLPSPREKAKITEALYKPPPS